MNEIQFLDLENALFEIGRKLGEINETQKERLKIEKEILGALKRKR